MEVLTDLEGANWFIRGDASQVTVLRQAPSAPGKEADKFRAVSYHNRLDQAMAWLLDQFLRQELEETPAEEFLSRIDSWKRRLEGVAEYWRQSVKSTVYED